MSIFISRCHFLKSVLDLKQQEWHPGVADDVTYIAQGMWNLLPVAPDPRAQVTPNPVCTCAFQTIQREFPEHVICARLRPLPVVSPVGNTLSPG